MKGTRGCCPLAAYYELWVLPELFGSFAISVPSASLPLSTERRQRAATNQTVKTMKRVRLKRMGASPKGEALRRPAKGPKLPPRNPKRGSKGARHQGPKDLMEAILAGEQSGEEARGRGGLAGYFYRLIHTEPRLFAALLGRLLSLEARDPRHAGSSVRTMNQTGSTSRKKKSARHFANAAFRSTSA
jgi:hypothetical protein